MSGGVFAAVFVALYVGHMVGDHVAQTDWQAARKADRNRTGIRAMAGHLLGYGACQFAAMGLVYNVAPFDGNMGFAGLAFSVATHGFIDRRWPVQWVCRHTGSETFAVSRNMTGAPGFVSDGPYLVDQTLHIACLFVAALIVVSGT